MLLSNQRPPHPPPPPLDTPIGEEGGSSSPVGSRDWLLSKGWFSLSKARFAMGCKSVSALQYGAHMEPQVRVCTSQGQSGPVTFQVIPGDLAPAAKTAEESPAGEGTRTQDPVMRRRKGPGAAEDPGPLSGAAPKHPAAQHGASPQDPLTWFGILVPQSLRQAQNSFKEGILLAGEIASLQSEIEVLRVQYRVLLERKHQLLAAEG
ncbi:vacuolar ATPase assembly protein VMA22 isoform X2 [Carettochelys insculpta]|uniref:vacuolar ATPase assembly protein VMA22 isoform X2 n=1 Tax=Carettochelys insculpta TaxID=44489 RepID=UPI003EB87BD3